MHIWKIIGCRIRDYTMYDKDMDSVVTWVDVCRWGWAMSIYTSLPANDQDPDPGPNNDPDPGPTMRSRPESGGYFGYR